jgi:hypothetical protein
MVPAQKEFTVLRRGWMGMQVSGKSQVGSHNRGIDHLLGSVKVSSSSCVPQLSLTESLSDKESDMRRKRRCAS